MRIPFTFVSTHQSNWFADEYCSLHKTNAKRWQWLVWSSELGRAKREVYSRGIKCITNFLYFTKKVEEQLTLWAKNWIFISSIGTFTSSITEPRVVVTVWSITTFWHSGGHSLSIKITSSVFVYPITWGENWQLIIN